MSWPGYEHRECGEHRPLGDEHSYCYDCSEKCSATGPCARCKLGELHHRGIEFPGESEPPPDGSWLTFDSIGP